MNGAEPEPRSWLNQLAFGLLVILVFTVPFDDVVVVPGFGTLSRLIGYAGVAAALGDILTKQRFRRPRGGFVWTLLFVIWAGLSLTWSFSMEWSVEKLSVMVRSAGMVWMLYEYMDGSARWRAVLASFVLGCYVCVGGLLMALRTGPLSEDLEYARYAVGQLDPNDLAATLTVGVPIAWYLAGSTRSRLIRWAARVYLPLAIASVLLTGSRGGVIALVVALGYVAGSLTRLSLGTKVIAMTALLGGLIAVQFLVPQTGLTRMATISDELREGTLSNRTLLWRAGFELMPDHPFGGAGIGAFRDEVFMRGGYFVPKVAHNVMLGVLFDLGLVGLGLFLAILVSIARGLARVPAEERRMSQFVLLVWLVAGLGLSLEYRKMTWVLLGCLIALTVRMGRRAWTFDLESGPPGGPPAADLPEPGMDAMEG